MEGFTISLGQRNGKIVIDYGFKGYTNLDLDKIPNLFNARDILKSVLMRETIWNKVKRYMKSLIWAFRAILHKEELEKTYSTQRPHQSMHIPVGKKEKITTF